MRIQTVSAIALAALTCLLAACGPTLAEDRNTGAKPSVDGPAGALTTSPTPAEPAPVPLPAPASSADDRPLVDMSFG